MSADPPAADAVPAANDASSAAAAGDASPTTAAAPAAGDAPAAATDSAAPAAAAPAQEAPTVAAGVPEPTAAQSSDSAEKKDEKMPEAADAGPAAKADPASGEAAKPADGEGEPAKAVCLAGRRFTSKAMLKEHVKKIQDSISDDVGRLSSESCIFLFHLFLHHPLAVDKMVSPISHFRYGTYNDFKNKCFIMCRADGSQEGVSAMKAINAVFDAPAAAPVVVGSTAPGSSQQQPEPRGVKREREEPPPRQFEPVEMVPGCVVDIHGCPQGAHYADLKAMLEDFGRVRFVSLPNEKRTRRGNKVPPVASVESSAPKAEGESAPKAGDQAADAKPAAMETDGGKAAEPAAADAKPADGEKAAAPAAPADPPAQGEPAAVAADGAKAGEATAPAASTEPASTADADDGESDDAERTTTARCRFDNAEGAKKALAELKEVEGKPVKVVLLEGEEELKFWADTNEKLKARFDSNDKGKGKDKGKDKGKGKGKGKGKDKGKGKGKGKKD